MAVHWHASAAPDKEATGQAKADLYSPALSEEQEEGNRKFAFSGYRRLPDGDVNVIDERWDSRYYQHNPAITNGTAPLQQFPQQGAQDGASSGGDAPAA
ncbi:hypothetical protein ACFZCL_32925 [Streptomyces sp. NPDC008159]|uniref:hypothetical protein n=1 Tax=Streptomyces sp. NPDC008159 TaxID=3364817 RepID=UPI0036EA2347